MSHLKKRYFLAGTDTDVGKTMVACALLAKARNMGLSTAAVKPVAAGCISTKDGLRNDDAEQLLAQCSLPLYYEQVNPVAFMAPIAPHIAAQQQGMRLGCINHALLTVEAITRDGLKLAGWVANCVDPTMVQLEANVVTLQNRIHAPMLGLIPHFADIDQASGRVEACQTYLDLETLLN